MPKDIVRPAKPLQLGSYICLRRLVGHPSQPITTTADPPNQRRQTDPKIFRNLTLRAPAGRHQPDRLVLEFLCKPSLLRHSSSPFTSGKISTFLKQVQKRACEGFLFSYFQPFSRKVERFSLKQSLNDTSPVALVTGSTSGIGAAIAQRLSSEGYAVVLHSRSSTKAGLALAAELGKATYIQADLANDADRIRLVREAVSWGGQLDVLVNNAGISRVIPHADLMAASPDVWADLHEVNVVAPFRLVAEAEAALRDSARRGRPGCVVNVSSHAGVRPKGASIPYAASKAALNHVTRLLAVSLAPNIRVNAVAPGLVDTPLTADWTAAQQLWRERSPMRRAARPEDVAQIVAMLVASDYLTGEILLSDGGLNLT